MLAPSSVHCGSQETGETARDTWSSASIGDSGARSTDGAATWGSVFHFNQAGYSGSVQPRRLTDFIFSFFRDKQLWPESALMGGPLDGDKNILKGKKTGIH